MSANADLAHRFAMPDFGVIARVESILLMRSAMAWITTVTTRPMKICLAVAILVTHRNVEAISESVKRDITFAKMTGHGRRGASLLKAQSWKNVMALITTVMALLITQSRCLTAVSPELSENAVPMKANARKVSRLVGRTGHGMAAMGLAQLTKSVMSWTMIVTD